MTEAINEISEMSKQEVLDKISILNTPNGQISYLREQLGQEGLPERTVQIMNAVLGNLYSQEGSLHEASRCYDAANLEGEEKTKAFTQLAEKFKVTKSWGGFEFGSAQKAYQKAGLEDKAREIGLQRVDASVNTNLLKDYESRIEKYQELGLSKKKARKRVLQKALEAMSAEERRIDVGELNQFANALKEMRKTELCSQYTTQFFEQYIKTKRSNQYYTNDIEMLGQLGNNDKDRIGLSLLEKFVKDGELDRASDIIPKLSLSTAPEGRARIVRGYLGAENTVKAFSLLESSNLEDKILWEQILWEQVAAQAKKSEDFARAALSYERTDSKEKASTCWTRYADSVVLSDQKLAAQAYLKAGLDDIQTSKKIGENLFGSNRIRHLTLSRQYFDKAGMSGEEIEKRASQLKSKLEHGRYPEASDELANLYETFGMQEDANKIYIALAESKLNGGHRGWDKSELQKGVEYYKKVGLSQEEIDTNLIQKSRLSRGLVDALEESGVSRRDLWITLGNRASDAESGEYPRLASQAFEKAGYQTGSVQEMEILADLYEASSQGTRALELRERILQVKK